MNDKMADDCTTRKVLLAAFWEYCSWFAL